MLISILPSCKTHPQITMSFGSGQTITAHNREKMGKKKINWNLAPKLIDQGRKSVGLTCSGRNQCSTTSWSFVLLFPVMWCRHYWKWSDLYWPKQQSLGFFFFLPRPGRSTKLGLVRGRWVCKTKVGGTCCCGFGRREKRKVKFEISWKELVGMRNEYDHWGEQRQSSDETSH